MRTGQLLKIVILFALTLAWSGCEDNTTKSPQSSQSIAISGVASLKYASTAQTNLSGTVSISVNGITNGVHVVTINNIKLDVTGCEESSTYAPITFTTNSTELFAISTTFSEACDQTTLNVLYDATVTTNDQTGEATSTTSANQTLLFAAVVTIETVTPIEQGKPPVIEKSQSNANLKMFFEPSFVEIYAPDQVQKIKIVIVDEKYIGHEANITLSKLFNSDGTIDEGNISAYGSFNDESLHATYYPDRHFGEVDAYFSAPSQLPSSTIKIATIRAKITEDFYVEKNITIRYQSTQDFQKDEYRIYASVPSSFQLNSRAYFGFKIASATDENNILDDSFINNISVDIKTDYLAEFSDIDNNLLGSGEQNISGKAIKTFIVQSNTKAGHGIITVSATIKTPNSDALTISRTFDFVVQSGPVSSISIVPDVNGTIYQNGLYTSNYTIHAVDQYANPVSTGEHVYVNVVNGLEIVSETIPHAETIFDINKTFEKHFYNSQGAISANENGGSTLTATGVDVNHIDINIDRVMILSNRIRNSADYTGSWTLDSIESNGSKLGLIEDYTGVDKDNLTFIIGDDTRYNPCALTNNVADLDSLDQTYKITNGIARFKIQYDPYLVGKDIYIAANTYNQTKRVGAAIREKIFGLGIEQNEFELIGPEDDDNDFTNLFSLAYMEPHLTQKQTELLVQNVRTKPIILEGACTIISQLSQLDGLLEARDRKSVV